MQRSTRTLLCSALALVATLITSCGSGSGSTVPANVRMVNDTVTELSLNLNGPNFIANVPAHSSSGYTTVTPGTYSASLSGSGVASSPNTVIGLGTNQNYTVLAYQRDNDFYAAAYADNQGLPSAGVSALDVANLSPDAGSLDIYLVHHPFTTLTGLQPTFLAVQGLSNSVTLESTNTGASPPIDYDIVVTGAGAASDLRLILSRPNFASAQQYTLALTSTAGGALVNSALIPQGIAVPASAFVPASAARVRLASALPQGASSAVTLGLVAGGLNAGSAISLANNIPYPTSYALVQAGSGITSLQGTYQTTDPVTQATVTQPLSLSVPTTTFTSGGDYTVLIYGTVAAPLVAVFADTNQVIADSASMRLINVAVPPALSSAGVTLLANSQRVASNVAYGTDLSVSPQGTTVYSAVTPAAAATLVLVGGGSTNTTYPNLSIVSGAVYTVIFYDPTQQPAVFRDR